MQWMKESTGSLPSRNVTKDSDSESPLVATLNQKSLSLSTRSDFLDGKQGDKGALNGIRLLDRLFVIYRKGLHSTSKGNFGFKLNGIA
jgi:hypothetical protein